MRVALYARVSSEEQKVNHTILTQRSFGEMWCQTQDHEIVGRYEDEDVKGTIPLVQRPEGARLLRDAARGLFEGVIVYRLDRWGRSQTVIFNGLELLEKQGIQFQSMTEPFDTVSPAGRAMLGMLATFAGFERDTILQRSWDGMQRVAGEGAWMGGVAPFGYRIVGQDAAARLEICEPEAEIIRSIFHLLTEEGYGCPRIASHLQALGTPTPHYFRQRPGSPSGFWRANVIRQIVVNPVYKGVHQWGRRGKKGVTIERPAPAIVDEAVWEAAQLRLKANLKFSPRNSKNAYLLKGLMRCSGCGYTYIGTQWKNGRKAPDGQYYYICIGRHQNKRVLGPDAKPCKAPYLDGAIEGEIWQDIEGFIRNPGEALQMLRERMEAEQGYTTSILRQADAVQRAYLAKQDERQRLIGLYRKQLIDETDLGKQLEEIKREEAALKAQSELLAERARGASETEESLRTADAFLRGMHTRIERALTFEEKRHIVSIFVKSILVTWEGRQPIVTVRYRFQAPTASELEGTETCGSQEPTATSSETRGRTGCSCAWRRMRGSPASGKAP